MSHSCIQCQITIQLDNSWMRVLQGDVTTHLCSYLCYRKGRDKYPKSLWPLVQNKEDFNDIRPVMNPSEIVETFQFLNHDELLQLSKEEVDKYYDDLEDHTVMNPMVTEIHHEQETEDRRIQGMEDEWESDASDSLDEY